MAPKLSAGSEPVKFLVELFRGGKIAPNDTPLKVQKRCPEAFGDRTAAAFKVAFCRCKEKVRNGNQGESGSLQTSLALRPF